MKEINIFSKITRKFKATTYSNQNYNIAPSIKYTKLYINFQFFVFLK